MLIKNRNLLLLVFLVIPLLFFGNIIKAQQQNLNFQNRLKTMLVNFNNVRFSSVNYYELNSTQVRSLKEVIKKQIDIEDEVLDENPNANNQGAMDPARQETIVSEIRKLIAQGRGQNIARIRQAFNGDVNDFEYLADLNATEEELRVCYNLARPQQRTKADIYRMFIITTQVESPLTDVPEIIALVLCKQRFDKSEYEQYLIQYYNEVIGNSLANDKNIITNPELKNMVFVDDYDDTKTTNMYDKLILEYRQGNFAPITAEVRGIGTELSFLKTYGKSVTIVSNENDITPSDIQRFIRISEGQPFDYTKENEIIVSPDYISWRKYSIRMWEDDEGNLYPINFANADLPSYGIELKYGLDEINYPSFFSERLMARAIWDNIKLGLVLPTPGWASFTKDIFDIDRRFTYGGLGVSAALDFPIKIIPQSGVFSASASYIFGNAKVPSYKDRGNSYFDTAEYNYKKDDFWFNDYLVRYTAQLHYSFGLSIDESYLLRFGIGATLYGAETWYHHEGVENIEEGTIDYPYEKGSSESVGGISMRIEFMSRDITTPFGASLQYFDESLFANAWIQIPIIENTFFARVEAKGFVAAFRENLRPWEHKSVFMPSVRLVFNF